ncbi:hypothetical protein LRAMOSA01899 [Lichtheimia ramosa]|uniref:protein-tyrosine-phosphatase n=1 Tax=Lichtheimia ramosa TaxID=688394 RepID=A0A077WKP4_9FUNG|nr:hypothetical protein LRAMOSA01899 [Lichtheimia ramosa]
MVQPKNPFSKNHKNLSLSLSLSNKPKQHTTTGPPSQEPQHVSHYEHGPAQILPNLFLGACHNALCPKVLDRHGISCIINVAQEIERPVSSTRSIRYHHLRWTHTQNNLAHREFHKAIRVLEAAHHTNTTVLVHCQSGVERSAALVIAYILHLSRQQQLTRSNNSNPVGKKKLSLWEAYDFVKERAPAIRPNMELLYQLSEFETLSSPRRNCITTNNNSTRVRRSGSVNAHSMIRKKSLNTSNNSNSNMSRPRAASFRCPARHRRLIEHELPAPPPLNTASKSPAEMSVPTQKLPPALTSVTINDSACLVILIACASMYVLFTQHRQRHNVMITTPSTTTIDSSSSSTKPCLNLVPSEPSTPMSPLFLHSLFPIC